MELWMSGEVWVDVADAHRVARTQIEHEVNKTVGERDYGKGVKQWAFITIMLPPDIEEQYPNVLSITSLTSL
jgi:hypothetical protein